MYYKSKSYRIFAICNTLLLAILSIMCILPMIHVLAVSFSGKAAVSGNLVNLWPIDFNLDAYRKTVANPAFINSILVSVERVVLGTTVGMLVILVGAYPLSKERNVFRFRSIFMWFFVFTMLFNGGIIPSYILITKLHLMNSIWALVLPGAVSVFNMIMLMNFYRNVPKELEEASLIDGANHLQTMWNVYLPISMPAIATLSLFTIVGHWNSWFDGLIYVTKPSNYPLATYLQTIVVEKDLSKLIQSANDMEKLTQRSIKAAQIFIAAVPVLIVYPFLQRHFVKGIVLGAVKE
ncbi:carbohydrate ABC transporter permease [Paenibacillus roseipurpureus]|uniref:Carbohydrate ABC transporter permease n=1 Tax=Paenibacillus roseopurpureus TaxID=2918901 RepID=A0AA96LTW1_9BACL|nr:carbohydrate ABC transporter permease [Paenibacillus sp. MBLB1832]WNR45984.1 carbohydrate ABC transporter permease [Paenibacillus sp. MBLB1832]